MALILRVPDPGTVLVTGTALPLFVAPSGLRASSAAFGARAGAFLAPSTLLVDDLVAQRAATGRAGFDSTALGGSR